MAVSDIQPGLLRRMTVRAILETLLRHGPLSRAELTRETGISAPTVSKGVSELLERKLVEETSVFENALGRPGKRLSLATTSSRVIGISVQSEHCEVSSASLDGRIDVARTQIFDTPSGYAALTELLTEAIRGIQSAGDFHISGIGISVPALVSRHDQIIRWSASVPFLNEQNLSGDLQAATGIPVVSVQHAQALCLAERLYGAARGLDDFLVLDLAESPAVGVFSDGEPLVGNSGLAGQLTAENGLPVSVGQMDPCANVVKSDRQFLEVASRRLGTDVTIETLAHQAGFRTMLDNEFDQAVAGFARVMGVAINIFNPSTLILFSRILSYDPNLFGRISDHVRQYALVPNLERCRIIPATLSYQSAAVAAIVDDLARKLGPRFA
jgi:predicted NBD/HSP70 family sugar kinase